MKGGEDNLKGRFGRHSQNGARYKVMTPYMNCLNLVVDVCSGNFFRLLHFGFESESIEVTGK